MDNLDCQDPDDCFPAGAGDLFVRFPPQDTAVEKNLMADGGLAAILQDGQFLVAEAAAKPLCA